MEKKIIIQDRNSSNSNHLFPVFLKLESLAVLVVGGGNVALEKCNAIINNSPAAKIKVVAPDVHQSITLMAGKHSNIQITEKAFEATDLAGIDVVIVAVNDPLVSEEVRSIAREKGKLVNVADQPQLCDFYLGSIVKKGNLKVAISTNGKSPTIAKRLKETFAEVLPEELDDVLGNMETIRSKMNGDFADKVHRLNKITRLLSINNGVETGFGEKKWRKIATWSLFAFFFMFLGHVLLSLVPFDKLVAAIETIPRYIDSDFYWMVLAGFLAQLVDGALGMGYGVTCSIILQSRGLNLAAISGSIHTAEMFSSGASGYSHYKFGNVNKKLFKALLIPGIIGAVLGAFLLSRFGDEYAKYMRSVLAAYTLFLGIKILLVAYRKNKKTSKVKRVGWLAGAGGFLDSFGGGGWGPLVTSTLISKGRTPKYVIGSVSISEFFVTLASALTFFSMLGISHWQVITGLIIGGTLAAPIAARLAGKLPLKTMFIGVGTMVIIWSLRILLKTLGVF